MTKLPCAIKRALWVLGLFSGGVVLLAVLAVVLLVDDWGRDLTQNTAQTDPEHPDPVMRDIETTAASEKVVEALESFVAGNPHWKFKGRVTIAPATTRVHLVRTTRFLRFRDDVTVELEGNGRTRVSISSASRVGQADFGQNPRNIRELTAWLRERLPSVEDA